MMIRLTGNLPQWSAAALGYYAVFSWACVLKQNDRATFRLIWGTPAFITPTLGYGLVALTPYALPFWWPLYAEQVLGLPNSDLAFVLVPKGPVAVFRGLCWVGGRPTRLRSHTRRGGPWFFVCGQPAPA